MNIVSLQGVKLIHRNPLHSYMVMMNTKREIKEMKERIKYLGINLTKETNRWGDSGNSVRLYFLELQNHCRW